MSRNVGRPSPWLSYRLTVFVMAFGALTGSANRLGGMGEASVEELSITAAVPAVCPVLFFFLGYLSFRRRGWWTFLWLFSLAGYVSFYWLDGGRGAGAFAVLMSAMGYFWGGMKVRRVLMGLAAIHPHLHSRVGSRVALS